MPYRSPEETQYSQDIFLEAYAMCGVIKDAAQAANTHPATITAWKNDDAYGFRSKFEQAKQDFREQLETLAFERIKDPEGNRGSDVLLIFLLKAHHPDKYREQIVQDDAARDFISDLRREAKKWKGRVGVEDLSELSVEQQVDEILYKRVADGTEDKEED